MLIIGCRPSEADGGLLVASDARESTTHSVDERISCMDIQQNIMEAIAEHLTVIQQLTAMSHLILQVASELVTTLRREGKVVLCGNLPVTHNF